MKYCLVMLVGFALATCGVSKGELVYFENFESGSPNNGWFNADTVLRTLSVESDNPRLGSASELRLQSFAEGPGAGSTAVG
jgi:hypothetical protein